MPCLFLNFVRLHFKCLVRETPLKCDLYSKGGRLTCRTERYAERVAFASSVSETLLIFPCALLGNSCLRASLLGKVISRLLHAKNARIDRG